MKTLLSHALAVKLVLDGFSLALLTIAVIRFWRLFPIRDWFRSIRLHFMPTGQQDNDRLAQLYREGKL